MSARERYRPWFHIEVEPIDCTPVCVICQNKVYILDEPFVRIDPPGGPPSEEILRLFGGTIDFRSIDLPVYYHRTCPRSSP